MKVLQSLIFYPRGGSAHVARAVAREGMRTGHDLHVVAGSLGGPGDATHAETFYDGLPLTVMDYNPAKRDFEAGLDPIASPVPFHPSYEPRGAVPDRLFSAVSPLLTSHLEDAWTQVFRGVRSVFSPDVLHIHHLTPQMAALSAVFPSIPKVVHLHGTELKMLEMLTGDSSDGLDEELTRYAEFWIAYLKDAAAQADQVIAVSEPDARTAAQLLHIPAARIDVVPNGVDTDLFRPAAGARRPKLVPLLTSSLVNDPRGSDETGTIGSVSYTADDLARAGLDSGTGQTVVLGYAGRFTDVKRVPLLLRSFARALQTTPHAVLVLFGGFPGEWEGVHPVVTARELASPRIFFAGWHSQAELADIFPLLDLLVLPSVNESFGLVIVEAFASGIPVVAVDRGGPAGIVTTDGESPDGWLVPPDDGDALTAALVDAIADRDELHRRGIAARATAVSRYSWSASFRQLMDSYAAATVREPS